VHGGDGPGIRVRVVGGGGDDVFIDSAGSTHFYDSSGENTFVRGPGTSVDRRAYDPPPVPLSQPHRDWGTLHRFPLWMGYSPDVGLLIGMGVERYQYGFRKLPWASLVKVRAAWGTTANTYRAEAQLRFNRENSAAYWLVSARASGLDILRFHGFGNQTVLDRPDDEYKVEQSQYAIEPRLVLPVGSRTSVSVGATVEFARTELGPGRFISEFRPYGAGDFGEAGAQLDVRLDGRDRARSPTRGAMLAVGGAIYPAVWDVEEAFGEVRGTATAYLSPWKPMQPTLALRGGARKLFGRFPFHEAAYLGDAATVRLGRDQRFGGEALAHANAELRLKLGRALLVLPADIGIFGLADIGRVWYDGDESNRWHDAVGGGLWFAFLHPENALSIAIARSDERTALYISAGFAY
jgi:hypothetical protein